MGALTVALLAGACKTPEQVKWATYSSGLQPRIDASAATGNCQALLVFRQTAERTSEAHEQATGVTNDALISYIGARQAEAGCPT